MGSFHAVYARIPDGRESTAFAAEVLAALRASRLAPDGRWRLRHRQGDAWLRIEPPLFSETPVVAQSLSTRFATAIVDLQIQTAAGCLDYQYFEDGTLQRRLACSDGAWGPFAGAPQDWEPAVIFSAEAREFDLDGDDDDDERRALVERAHSTLTIDLANGIPFPSETNLHDGLTAHLHLWGWGGEGAADIVDLDTVVDLGAGRRAIANALVAGAFLVTLVLAHLHLGLLPLAGLVPAWAGFALRWRRNNRVTDWLLGGLLAAGAVTALAVVVGRAWR